MPLTSTSTNATRDDPPELESNPYPQSSPQTDYLAMTPNELLSQHNNITESRAIATAIVRPSHNQSRGHDDDKTLIAELIDFAKNRNWKKKLLTVVIVTSSMGVFVDLIFFGNIQRLLVIFLEWMTTHTTLAVFCFLVIFVVSTLIFIPPPFLIFGAGYAFAQACDTQVEGIVAALISCVIGSGIGALLAFYRSRYMMRDLVKLFANRYPIIHAADTALQHNGFRIMLLLRLCPIVPFNGLNYIGGVTKVSAQDFTLALVGTLPFQLLLVVIGATTETLVEVDLTNAQQLGLIITVCAGIGFGIVAMIATWKACQTELQKALQVTDAQMERFLHPDDKLANDTMPSGIERNWIDESITTTATTNENDRLEQEEEWFWIWA